jgi:hypothetical protein
MDQGFFYFTLLHHFEPDFSEESAQIGFSGLLVVDLFSKIIGSLGNQILQEVHFQKLVFMENLALKPIFFRNL